MKRSKYNVSSDKSDRTFNNIVFHTVGECNRYKALLLAMRDGLIRDISLQPKFKIYLNGIYICQYIADFRYKTVTEFEGIPPETEVIDDFKGVHTNVFKLKAKLFKAHFPHLHLVLSGKGGTRKRSSKRQRRKKNAVEQLK